MTVLDNTPRDQYTASGGQVAFTYTFEIAAEGDIAVLQNGTLLNLGAGAGEYAVTGVGVDAGGTVTLVTGATAGDIITLYRDMALNRLTSYTNGGDFLAADVNNDYDRLWLALQQNTGVSTRALVAPNTDPTDIDMTIPGKADRLGKLLQFNITTGNPEVVEASTAGLPASLVSFTQLGTGAVERTVEQKLNESVSVKDFGADPTGATDSTAAIQAAINSGAASVFVPEGTYIINSALRLTVAGQQLVGASKTKSIIKQTAVNTNGLYIQADNVYIGHLQVKDIINTVGPTGEYHSILWEHRDGVTVEHCKIDTSDDAGIRAGYDPTLGKSTNSRILFNDITNVANGSGIEIIGALDCLCEGNDVEGTNEHGIRIVASSRVQCVNNRIEHFAEGGAGHGLYVSGGTAPGFTIAERNVVQGNIVQLNTSIATTGVRSGIYIADDAIGCVIADNIFDLNDSTGNTDVWGVWARKGSGSSSIGVSRCVIANNRFTGDLAVGIGLIDASTHYTITGNLVKGFQLTGIKFGTTRNLILTGNTFIGRNYTDCASAIESDVSLIDGVISSNSIDTVCRAFNLRGIVSRVAITNNNARNIIDTGGTAYGFNVLTTGDLLTISNNFISNEDAVGGDSLQYANITVGATDRVYFYDNIVEASAGSTLVPFQMGTGKIQVSYLNYVQTLANDATPSVDLLSTVKTGGTTTITDFDDGVVGQELLILSDHAVTITDNAAIILAGGVSYVMKASDTLTLRMINDQVWNEVSRSVN